MLKEEKLPFDSFIGGWYIPEKMCDDIIQYHKDNKDYISKFQRKI